MKYKSNFDFTFDYNINILTLSLGISKSTNLLDQLTSFFLLCKLLFQVQYQSILIDVTIGMLCNINYIYVFAGRGLLINLHNDI